MPSSPRSLPCETFTCNTVRTTRPLAAATTVPPCSATYMGDVWLPRHASATGLDSPDATRWSRMRAPARLARGAAADADAETELGRNKPAASATASDAERRGRRIGSG